MQALRLDAITLDPDLQPRASIDDDQVRDYAEALADGAQFPRIVVFLDGATYWLADGYHRWHAHRQARVEEIAATVRQGSKQDALRFSLSANAQHGKQRQAGDYRKAYEISCRNDLVEAHDTDAVQSLLQCSIRWARDLTKNAREAKDRKRDEAIRAERAKGASNREIGRKLGVPHSTVDRVAAPERKSSVSGQAAAPTAPPPRPASRQDVAALRDTIAANGQCRDNAGTVVPKAVQPPDPPPRPAFNPEAFKAAADRHKDMGNILWADLIDGLEALARVTDAAALAAHPRPDLIAQAMPLAHAAVATITTIIADAKAADAQAA